MIKITKKQICEKNFRNKETKLKKNIIFICKQSNKFIYFWGQKMHMNILTPTKK
jgi:hypothetical protein